MSERKNAGKEGALKKCKLFTKSKTDFGNKFVMHVTCPNNACASSCDRVCGHLCLCVCVCVCVCVYGRL